MSRTLAGSAILLIVFAIPPAFLAADEPPVTKPRQPSPSPANSGYSLSFGGPIANGPPAPNSAFNTQGTFVVSGTDTNKAAATIGGADTYTGSTSVTSGVLTLGNYWSGATEGDEVTFDESAAYGGGPATISAPQTPITPIPKGPVFYIITEGAGVGDSVRTVPCTGKETVLSAVGAVGGISQVSGTKLWIARPSSAGAGKSSILPVDWEAIAKRGDNSTNYTLMPDDRLVFGEDPAITRSNLLNKKTGPIERISGVVGLATSTLKGVQNTPGGGKLVKDLVDKNLITDDPQLKTIILDAIGNDARSKTPSPPEFTLGMTFMEPIGNDAQSKKRAAKTKDDPKPSEGKAAVGAGDTGTNILPRFEQRGDEPKSGMPSKEDKSTNGGLFFLNGIVSNAAEASAPHELAMRPLPDYRIEPPDVIQVEMLKLVPLPPYRAGIFDVLQIRANALPDQPIDNYFMVQADGTVNLGPTYGSVHVAGMTIEEMKAALNKWLHQWLIDPAVSVELARVSGAQPVTGQYLVAQDGTINLRRYGRVNISGMTVAEAKAAIEKRLANFLLAPEVSIDVVSYKSKTYFVITQGAGLGDSVHRIPITGNETVLDAIGQIHGLSQISDSKKIWIVRPSASDPAKAAVLPVDWQAITRRGETATNYQIFPRDRVYIGEDRLLTATNLLSKKTAPIERAMGVISLATSTVRSIDETPGGAAAVKQLVQKGLFDDDPQVKRIVQETISVCEEEGRKDAKSGEAKKPRQ